MKLKKILFIIIPLIIAVLALGGGFAYLMLNSTPEKIFTISINKVFEVLKTEEEDITTLKGNMKLSGSIESDDEEVQAISDILETSSVTLNMAVDTEKMIVNENIDVIYEDESILDASILLQDEKGYIYLPDFLDKYLEIPEEELEFSELEEMLNNTKTLNQNLILNSIQTEILNAISKQEFKQEKNGKIKASILDLSQEQFYNLYGEVIRNLKQNANFNSALGNYKDDVITVIDDMLEDFSDFEADGESRAIISIYTEGLFNKFRGFGIELKTGEDVDAGILFTVSGQNYEFSMYSQYDGEREEILKVRIEDRKENKNNGTATITVTADEDEFVIVYKYENKENQTNFKATTEIDGVMFEVTGNTIKDGNSIAGKLGFLFEQEEATININADYNFAYGVEIKKTNMEDAMLIDEISEEDQKEMMDNLQDSKLYEFIEPLIKQVASNYTNFSLTVLEYNGNTLVYDIPTGFIASFNNMEDYKTYTDEKNNSISVFIEETDVETYLGDLGNDYILTSGDYKNQEISDVLDYDANGKLYKYRTITYSDEYASYVNLYFAYELEEGYTYVVKVESEGGQIALEDINEFLNIRIQKDSINNITVWIMHKFRIKFYRKLKNVELV